MGCSSSYMEPSAAESNSIRVSKLIVFLRDQGYCKGDDFENQWSSITFAAGSRYGNTARLDEYTRLLCAELKTIPEETFAKLIASNYKSKVALDLAAWKTEHEKADLHREVREKQKRQSNIEDSVKLLTEAQLSDDELQAVIQQLTAQANGRT